MTLPGIGFASEHSFSSVIQAVDLKMKLEQLFDEGKLTDDQKKILRELNEQISEEDNPIVITGTLK